MRTAGRGARVGGCRHIEPDRGRHQEAWVTSTGEGIQDIKSVYRIRMQSFSLSPRTVQPPAKPGPAVGLQTFPLCHGGTGRQGHGSWLGLALLPKPGWGVRRCLGSCDTSAKRDPRTQAPSRKPDPDLEGLNLSLSSLRNHRITRPKQSPVRGIKPNAAPAPPQPGQVRSGDYGSGAGEILLGQIPSTR